MKKFVKLKSIQRGDYEGWFLELSKPSMDFDDIESLNKTMVEYEFHRGLNDPNQLNSISRLNLLAGNPINYNELVTKYGTIYIRQIGSWMCGGTDTIVTAQVYVDSWPTNNKFAEIVVCENDFEAENRWMSFLDYQFSGKQVNVLNTFRHRTLTDVCGHFKFAKYITFTTTFSNYDWFELLLDGVGEMSNKTVIGHTYDLDKWEEIKELYGDRIKKWIEQGNEFKIIKSFAITEIKLEDLI